MCYDDFANFVGKYCMPVNGAKLSEQSMMLTNNEMVRLVSLFAERGVDKIRITGGEPTVRKDIVEIVGKFKTGKFGFRKR